MSAASAAPAWENVTGFARRRQADNPGPMTLDGTNSYVLGDPGAGGVAVVDPGPLLPGHLAELAAAGAVELILITHRHGDHTDGSARLHDLTGAPVRAALPEFCHGGSPLDDGELLHAGGLTVEVLATPGHTSDSLCFAVHPGQSPTLMLTGDTILGSGSTVLDYPDGTLGDYLRSLDRLRAWAARAQGPVQVLPGHGPVLPDLDAAAAGYEAHRVQRLEQVRTAVERLRAAGGPTAGQVAEAVYGDIPEQLRPAALLSVQAQLDYLRVG